MHCSPNKVISSLVTLLFIMFFVFSFSLIDIFAEINQSKGDFNLDGKINIQDYLLAKDYLSGEMNNSYQFENIDYCEDNTLDAFDLYYLNKAVYTYDNTFLMSHAVYGKIYAPVTAQLKNNSSMVSFSPFDVTGYDKISVQNSKRVDYPRVMVFFDYNMNIITEYSALESENQPYPTTTFRSVMINNTSICVIDIPENSVYCAFTVVSDRLDNLKVYLSKSKDFYPLPIETHGYFESFENSTTQLPEIMPVESNWFGKKVVTLGDSITQGYKLRGTELPWSAQTASMLGMEFVNYGIGGSEIAQFEQDNNTYNPMCLRYQEMDDDADLVIVAGGTNDWSHNHTCLGVFGDTSINTFYGAIDTLCCGLKNKYPDAKIIFMTPIKRATDYQFGNYTNNNSYGFKLADICNAIEQTCDKYNITVLDMFNISDLDPTDNVCREKLIPDGTHPNYLGHIDMARDVVNFLKSIE